jgi:very-long-chain (3R)-3-hydroxyacyl-CoA dehydratase
MRATDTYLLAYNLVSWAAWVYILWLTLSHLTTHRSPQDWHTLYDHVGTTLLWVQTVSILETVHSALRLVKSNVSSTFLQCTSSLHF